MLQGDTQVIPVDPSNTPDSPSSPNNNESTPPPPPPKKKEETNTNESITSFAWICRSLQNTAPSQEAETISPWISKFTHVLHFCYLCSARKIEPIIYTMPGSNDITDWQETLEQLHLSHALSATMAVSNVM
jgi:hypothetical protein